MIIYSCAMEATPGYSKQAIYVEKHKPSELFLLVDATISLAGSSMISSVETVVYQFSMWQVMWSEEGGVNNIINLYHPTNHTSVVNCHQNDELDLECDSFAVAYLPHYDDIPVLILVEIVSQQRLKLGSFALQGISAAEGYTNSVIAIRYTFMSLSLISFMIYAYRLYRLNHIHHVIE